MPHSPRCWPTGRTGASGTAPPLRTARLEAAFAARLSDFPAGTRTLLLLASLDDSGDTGDLLKAAELVLARPLGTEAFDPAVAGGLGVVESGQFRFRHPLMRSAVQQAAAPAERRAGHAALAPASLTLSLIHI